MCGRLEYKFTDLESGLEITSFPHKGIFWDDKFNQVSLEPQSTDPVGQHIILITVYLPSFQGVLATAQISYLVHTAPEDPH